MPDGSFLNIDVRNARPVLGEYFSNSTNIRNRFIYLQQADKQGYQALRAWVMQDKQPDDADLDFLKKHGHLHESGKRPSDDAFNFFYEIEREGSKPNTPNALMPRV